jgi:hypothetical protein
VRSCHSAPSPVGGIVGQSNEEIYSMKRLVALGVAISSVFLLQGTASAAHGNIQSLTVDETVILLNNGTARITGTITCTTGATNARWRVGAKLTQPGATTNKQGPDTGNCTGTAQPWTVFVSPGAGESYQPGPGEVQAAAQTGDSSGTVIDRRTTTERVTVVGQ